MISLYWYQKVCAGDLPLTVPVYRVVRSRGKGKHCPCNVVIELQHTCQRVRHGLAPDLHHLCVLLLPLETGIQFVERVFDGIHPGIPAFLHRGHGFGRSSRLRGRRLLVIVLSVDKGMSTRPPFDLPQSHQISPFKVSISVLEFPEGRVRRSVMENIAHLFMLGSSMSPGVERVAYLCGIHTY